MLGTHNVRIVVVPRLLHPDLQPVHAVRHDGVTVLFTDPRCSVEAGVAWSLEHLTVDERNAIRAGLGQPPVGQPLTPDIWNVQPGYIPGMTLDKIDAPPPLR